MSHTEPAHDATGPRYIIPRDWRSHPELLPALRILVEGARRVAEKRLKAQRQGA